MLTPTPIEYLDLNSDILENSHITDDELLKRFKNHISESDYCFGTNKFSLISIDDFKELFIDFDEMYQEEFNEDEIKHLKVLLDFIIEIQQTNPDVYVNLEN